MRAALGVEERLGKRGSDDGGEDSAMDWGEVVGSVKENKLRHFLSQY